MTTKGTAGAATPGGRDFFDAMSLPPDDGLTDFQRALNRMCTPLDESHLRGVTAEEDARCMVLIRKTVANLAAALQELLATEQAMGEPEYADRYVAAIAQARAALASSGQ